MRISFEIEKKIAEKKFEWWFNGGFGGMLTSISAKNFSSH